MLRWILGGRSLVLAPLGWMGLGWMAGAGLLVGGCGAEADCRAGCLGGFTSLELAPAIYFKGGMRVDFVSGDRVVDSQTLHPSSEPQATLETENVGSLTIRWYLDDALWFEQPVATSMRTHSVCGQTCSSYRGTLSLPETLPDGTRVDALLPDCVAVACRDKVVVSLVDPIAAREFETVSVSDPTLGFYECGLSCSTFCTFGAQASDVNACVPSLGATLEALTYWGRAETLIVRGVTQQDGADLSFTRSVAVEPAERHVPSAPATACSPGCFVGVASLEWPPTLRGTEHTGGAAGATGSEAD